MLSINASIFLLSASKMLQVCVAFATCYLLDVACCILNCCIQELFWDYDCHAASTFFACAFCMFFQGAKKMTWVLILLQNVAVEPSIFLDDDMQNVAHEEEEYGIDLNDTPQNDSDDSLQLNTDGVAPNHGNARVASDNANGNAATLVDEPDEDISSQPVVPFVGMVFDNVEEAQRVYNEYASKMGFGTRIVTSKHSRKNSLE